MLRIIPALLLAALVYGCDGQERPESGAEFDLEEFKMYLGELDNDTGQVSRSIRTSGIIRMREIPVFVEFNFTAKGTDADFRNTLFGRAGELMWEIARLSKLRPRIGMQLSGVNIIVGDRRRAEVLLSEFSRWSDEIRENSPMILQALDDLGAGSSPDVCVTFVADDENGTINSAIAINELPTTISAATNCMLNGSLLGLGVVPEAFVQSAMSNGESPLEPRDALTERERLVIRMLYSGVFEPGQPVEEITERQFRSALEIAKQRVN